MTDQKIERASCRFIAKTASDGRPALRIELFHPLASLAGITVDFELLSGTTLDQARKLAESINERTLGVIVSKKANLPSRE